MYNLINDIKTIIANNITDTDLIRTNLPKGFHVLASTCFWHKCNFSAIIKYKGEEFYCRYNDKTKEVIVEKSRNYSFEQAKLV